MCRIAGILNSGIPIENIEQKTTLMCDLQIHGGPDDFGIYYSKKNKLVLGNRRLSLLDLTSAGHMPMQYKNRYHITYNGEIYNFLELKKELIELGHLFSNGTDTEVILAAYSQWGTLSFSKLNGMFAFALWDEVAEELFLVRDAVGIKPLYYSTVSDNLIFASELRAFDVIPELNEQNKNWPIFMMAYGHIPEPVSTLKEVTQLHKGCFLKYNTQTKKKSIQSFLHHSFSNKVQNKKDAIDNIQHLLNQSVENQLLADAPVAVFLSGGLDSGIIASIAAQHKSGKLNALSIYFEEKEYSEKTFQDILINQLNCDSHQLLLKEEVFHNSFQSILDSMDMPSCDGINTWFISKYASENGFKAVLSGLGGDELFGGYPSFKRVNASQLLQHLPDFIKTIGKKSASKRLSRLSYLKLDGIKGIYLFLRGHFNPYEIAKQLGTYEKEVWNCLNEIPTLLPLHNLENKNKISWMEFNLYMQNQLLRDADVMSMIHGVEIRVPFLDNNLIKYTNDINESIKYEGKLPKQLLIDSFKNIIAKEIWDRPKMGFSFPFAKWMANSDYIKNASSINTSLNINYKKFLRGTIHWSQMMNLIILDHRKVL